MAEKWQEVLTEIEWVDGKCVERAIVGSYRHAITVICSKLGRQKAQFANGEYPYFAYIELLGSGGKWITHGTNIVPILPDHRLIMVVEQRPPHGRFAERPRFIELKKGTIDLNDFGPFSSLEFPGGAIEPGESFTAGFLRELQEESGVGEQSATLYRTLRPHYPFGADIALQAFLGVVFLSGLSYTEQVEHDGGLRVLALTEKEVQKNICNGVIASAQAALLGWAFYKEVKEMLGNTRMPTESEMVKSGYLAIEHVKIIKPK